MSTTRTSTARTSTTRTSTAIEVSGLVKRFGSFTAVNGVSFEIASGQVTALLGPNGAGKTTTIEMLEGFQSPTAGTISVLGASPRKGGSAWRGRIGLVLQTTSLDAQLTVAEAIGLYGTLYKQPLSLREVLESIDMTEDAGTRIGALSGGQKRRVDLGIAIIGRPELLFLDEPTTGLDPEVRRRMWHVIERLTEAGTTTLLTTHYMDEAQYLASRVIVLAGGQIAADATPAELRAQGGPPVITFRPPAGSPELPAALRDRTLAGTDDLIGLVTWARDHHVELTGLEVSPPSLEDAYLALTEHTGAANVPA
jgi:ABC-2 type transport system ATP-binding protein